MTAEPKLSGLIPADLKIRSARILLKSLAVQADIGFHEFENGAPQRLLVTVEIWLHDLSAPEDDDPAMAWNYDFLRIEVAEIAGSRRWNLQETLAHAVFERLEAGELRLKAKDVPRIDECAAGDAAVPQAIQLIRIESPGLTSAPAIAEHVAQLVAETFD